MFNVGLAGFTISVDNKYEYVRKLCEGYIVDTEDFDFGVSVNFDEIKVEQTGEFDLGYLESLAILRKLAEKLFAYDILLIHGILMECFGRGILICAPSGVGKTTHANYWCELLGDDCKIVNGDKPFVHITENGVTAYGTPWSGKEQLNINKSVKLTDICFLERADENKAEALTEDVIKPLFNQIHLPNKDQIFKALKLADLLLGKTKQWKIYCANDISAARTVIHALWA